LAIRLSTVATDVALGDPSTATLAIRDDDREDDQVGTEPRTAAEPSPRGPGVDPDGGLVDEGDALCGDVVRAAGLGL
jgi:hypothetical protein